MGQYNSYSGRGAGGSRDSNTNNNKKMDEELKKADTFFRSMKFDNAWIKEGADRKLVDYAEKTGEFMGKKGLKSSQIRGIYGEIKRIQMGGFEKEKSAFFLLKPKVAYALGRDKNNEGLKLYKCVFDTAVSCVSDDKTFQNFCNMMEAIVAYHKVYVERDK